MFKKNYKTALDDTIFVNFFFFIKSLLKTAIFA